MKSITQHDFKVSYSDILISNTLTGKIIAIIVTESQFARFCELRKFQGNKCLLCCILDLICPQLTIPVISPASAIISLLFKCSFRLHSVQIYDLFKNIIKYIHQFDYFNLFPSQNCDSVRKLMTPSRSFF